jgi:hypothetical protein
MVFYVQLPGFPEWAIPMTKVVPMFSTEDGYDLSTVTWNCYCTHLWHVIESSGEAPNAVELRVDVEVSATIPNSADPAKPTSIPVYLDLDLVFLDQRVAQEINTNKS